MPKTIPIIDIDINSSKNPVMPLSSVLALYNKTKL